MTTYAPPSKRSAFTLVELLVVIGIMATLLVLVVPSFTGLGRGQSMRSAVTQLRSTVSLARQWAITRNEKTYVIFPDHKINYMPRENVKMALRSYAVWGEKSGYISDWRYLPPGVFFLTNAWGKNIFDDGSDTKQNVAFPTNNASLMEMYCIAFSANGRLKDIEEGNSRLVYLSEGWVEVNTNSGAVLSLNSKSTNYIMYFEVRPLTGQIKIGER